jgi:NAD(P)-dependent dehydrogenase (short-subunit alcohol dehydrogenase family)
LRCNDNWHILLDAMKKDKRIEWRRVDPASLDLKGTNVAIVGGTGGIGRALARFMTSRGASVIVVGQTFRDAGAEGIEFIKADLSLMSEAQRVGETLPAETLDMVVFTTGIFAAPKREVTAEGIERDMAVSYLSRLVILREIAPRLGKKRTAPTLKPRVFVMGYPGTGQAGTPDDLNGEKAYGAMSQHMNTVAGNEALVLDAAQRYPDIAVFGINPGLIKTNIRDNFLGAGSMKSRAVESLIGLLTPSVDSYAQRLTPLLVSPDLESHSGTMFDRKGLAVLPSPKLTDAAYVSVLISGSEALASRAR